MAWDHEDLNRQRVRRMLALQSEGDAVLVIEDTGFAKQGMRSVGVQRQYSGTLGKTGNCQVAVSCHYAERTLAWPVGVRLYLPRPWAEGLVSLVTLLATRLVRAGMLPLRSTAWYQKSAPTFSDALAAVRAEFWRHQSFHISTVRIDIPKPARRLLTRLTTILCEAA